MFSLQRPELLRRDADTPVLLSIGFVVNPYDPVPDVQRLTYAMRWRAV